MDVEGSVEAGDLEDLRDPLLGADERQVAVEAAEPLHATDQHAEAGRVEELHLVEVDHDLLGTGTRQLHQLLPQTRSGGQIHLTSNRQHRERLPALVDLELQVHAPETLANGLLYDPNPTIRVRQVS